jgi:autotransporter-associated beta strand protein
LQAGSSVNTTFGGTLSLGGSTGGTAGLNDGLLASGALLLTRTTYLDSSTTSNLLKVGAGKLLLNGSNTFTGATTLAPTSLTVNTGTLILGGLTAINATLPPGPVNDPISYYGILTMTGVSSGGGYLGTGFVLNTNPVGAANLVIDPNSSATATATSPITYYGTLTLNGTGALAGVGSNTVTNVVNVGTLAIVDGNVAEPTRFGTLTTATSAPAAPAPVPEPTTTALVAGGLLTLAFRRRRS